MALYYGQPLTEEERQAKLLQEMYGIAPPGAAVDAHPPPTPMDSMATRSLGVSGPAPMPDTERMRQEALALSGDPNMGDPARSIMLPPDTGAKPEPERVGMNAGQGVAIALGGLADMANVYERLKTGRGQPSYANAIAGQVNSDIARNQSRNDKLFQQGIQNDRAERYLGMQERAADRENLREQMLDDPNSPLSKQYQAILTRQAEQGVVNMTPEQISKVSARAYTTGDFMREASTNRGTQAAIQQADAAHDRRDSDAMEQRRMLTEAGFVIPEGTSEQAINQIFSSAMLDKRLAAMLERSKKKGGGGSGTGDVGQLSSNRIPTTALWVAPQDVVKQHLANLEAQESQVVQGPGDAADKRLLRDILRDDKKAAREISERRVGEWGMWKMPTSGDATKAKAVNASIIQVREAAARMEELAPKGMADMLMREANAFGEKFGLSDQQVAQRRGDYLRNAETVKNAFLRIRELGVPTGKDDEIITKMSGDLTGWATQAGGRAVVTVRGVLQNLETESRVKMGEWGYVPPEEAQRQWKEQQGLSSGGADPGDTAGASTMTDDELEELLMLRRKKAGGM